jgi:hypothetical protein
MFICCSNFHLKKIIHLSVKIFKQIIHFLLFYSHKIIQTEFKLCFQVQNLALIYFKSL